MKTRSLESGRRGGSEKSSFAMYFWCKLRPPPPPRATRWRTTHTTNATDFHAPGTRSTQERLCPRVPLQGGCYRGPASCRLYDLLFLIEVRYVHQEWGLKWSGCKVRIRLWPHLPEGKGPQRRPQRRLGRRLEEVAKAVEGGYCRLQMPLKPALGVRETVAGHRLGALKGGGGPSPLPMHPWRLPHGCHHLLSIMSMHGAFTVRFVIAGSALGPASAHCTGAPDSNGVCVPPGQGSQGGGGAPPPTAVGHSNTSPALRLCVD